MEYKFTMETPIEFYSLGLYGKLAWVGISYLKDLDRDLNNSVFESLKWADTHAEARRFLLMMVGRVTGLSEHHVFRGCNELEAAGLLRFVTEGKPLFSRPRADDTVVASEPAPVTKAEPDADADHTPETKADPDAAPELVVAPALELTPEKAKIRDEYVIWPKGANTWGEQECSVWRALYANATWASDRKIGEVSIKRADIIAYIRAKVGAVSDVLVVSGIAKLEERGYIRTREGVQRRNKGRPPNCYTLDPYLIIGSKWALFDEDELYSMREVAHIIGVSDKTLCDMALTAPDFETFPMAYGVCSGYKLNAWAAMHQRLQLGNAKNVGTKPTDGVTP
ncbi:MAG: hypothetical protein IJR14_03235 [Synergistaceae bacterium]|nr:hypothetical protein [Synergistaceae bacterium]